MTRLSLKILTLMMVMVFFGTAIATAQDDGRANTSAADRVVAYCRSNSVEIWGTDTLGVGFYMTTIRYADLLAPGMVARFTNYGQILADATVDGSIDVFWLGGQFGGTGTGDFAIWFECALPLIVQTTATSTPVSTPVTTTTTTITVTPNPVTNTNTTLTCNYTRIHTVQEGENLFRIGLRYGVSFTTLAACNNIIDPTRIYVGQQIRVP